MTKKLQKMMKSASKKKRTKKVKEKKLTKKERLAVRGIKLVVGTKRAMELMCEHVKMQKHPVPPVVLRSENPASQFSIAMYSELGKWDDQNLHLYIYAVTGAPPKHTEAGAMQGTVKAIFHAIFEEGASKEEVNRYDSVWKMWPNVRSKLSRKERRNSMATRKASKKKVSKKRAARKTAGKKVTKRAAKSNGAGRVSDESKVAKTRKTFDPARESFRLDVYGKINQKNNTVARITKAVGEDRSFVIKELRWLRNRDFLTIK
ncbi:MAG: hypothetical protein KAJ19_28875 [Gammaproteobacteria bacterium]|nr:hypothetical protein [Gammaproteobacteria bacterium]